MSMVSVIIPFLNEEENIPFLTQSLNDYFKENSHIKAEVIFVNDGSTDESIKVLKEQTHAHYSSKVISFSKNFGSHAALRAGIQQASGDFICFIYADLQDPLELIDQLLKQCKAGYDIVWATREKADNSAFEKAFSYAYAYLMKKYAISSFPEKGFDIVMFNTKVQKLLNDNIEANSSIFLQILTFGFLQTSIYYNKSARKKGKSKWTLSKKIKLFVDSFIAFSFAPIRFVTYVGILLFIAGISFSAYLIIRKILFNDLNSGWPLLASILSVGFGITNISLGILAEYLWRNLDATRKRPVFIIDQIIELKNDN
ncbi:MAG: glycosyltransferase [Bacteroidota bacterium]|nr:glycosyltransferase [Bacteroidota bacterium]